MACLYNQWQYCSILEVDLDTVTLEYELLCLNFYSIIYSPININKHYNIHGFNLKINEKSSSCIL